MPSYINRMIRGLRKGGGLRINRKKYNSSNYSDDLECDDSLFYELRCNGSFKHVLRMSSANF